MRRRRVLVGIPSATMADLALLLLIFFLTTAYFQTAEGPALDLPVALAGDEEPSERTWNLYLSLDRTLHLQGQAMTPEEASNRIFGARRDGDLERLLFYADRALPFAAVYPVLEELRGENELPVLLISEPDHPAPGRGEEEEGP